MRGAMKSPLSRSLNAVLLIGLVVVAQPDGAGSMSRQSAAAPLPNGIYPESGNRLPLIQRASLDEYGRTRFDEIEADMRTGRLLAGFYGPSGIRLHSPRVSSRPVNQYLRFESP